MKFTGVGIFRHFYSNPKQISKFEERVVITTATSKKKAEKLILAEFKEYSTDGIEFTDEYTVTEVLEDNLVTEVAHVTLP
jgi:hypothetical protein